VLLNTKTYNVKKPTRSLKFIPRFAGPFKVIEAIGPSAYRVERPDGCLIHPVIHVSKLWPYRSDSRNTPPATVLLEQAEHFTVHAILAKRGKRNSIQYLVQWMGYDALHNTWEPADNLLPTCSKMVQEFEQSKSDVQSLRMDCYSIEAPVKQSSNLSNPSEDYREMRATSRTRPVDNAQTDCGYICR